MEETTKTAPAPLLSWEMSAECAALFAALSKAQGEIRTAIRDTHNPHFRSQYADLDAVWEACRGPLSKNGLAVVQMPRTWQTERGRGVTLRALLTHASGQWISCELTMEVADLRPQTVGSAITYARRYTLAPLVGVAPGDDDDGEAAEGRAVDRRPASQAPSAPASTPRQTPQERSSAKAKIQPHIHPTDDGEAASDEDADRIRKLLTGAKPDGLAMPRPAASDWLLKRFGIEGPREMTKLQARAAEMLLVAKLKGDAEYRKELAELVADGWVRGDAQEQAA